MKTYKIHSYKFLASCALIALSLSSGAYAEELQDGQELFTQSLRKGLAPHPLTKAEPVTPLLERIDESQEKSSFVFGESQSPMMGGEESVTNDAYRPTLTGFVEVDTAYLPDGDSKSDITAHTKLRPELEWQVNENWGLKASVDIDHYSETGSNDFHDTDLRYHENYIRYSQENFKITAGAQKVIWGRVDGYKPTDQLGSQDLRTLVTDDYEDRRQAVPALRGEYFAGDIKVDGMFVFDLRETELADRDSLWSTIDTRSGRVIGLPSNDILAGIVQDNSFGEDDDGIGGGGVRLTKASEAADFGVTVQRVKRSLPFYEVNPQVVGALAGGAPLATALASATGDTLTAIHPWNWVVGGDVAVPVGTTILRAEAAWMSDVPAYTSNLTTDYVDQVQLVAGAEFYPGDGDLRIIVQGAASVLQDAEHVIDRNEVYSLNGSIENQFAQGRWIADVDYSIGLDERDFYVNPKITYAGFDGHDLYAEVHYFEGSSITPGGYFEDNSQIMAGWKYDF